MWSAHTFSKFGFMHWLIREDDACRWSLHAIFKRWSIVFTFEYLRIIQKPISLYETAYVHHPLARTNGANQIVASRRRPSNFELKVLGNWQHLHELDHILLRHEKIPLLKSNDDGNLPKSTSSMIVRALEKSATRK